MDEGSLMTRSVCCGALLATMFFAAAQSAQPSSNSEQLRFSHVDGVPPERDAIAATTNEAWSFVPSWSDMRSGTGPQPTSREDRATNDRAVRYRQKSPFVVFDKRSRQWRMVAISRHAYEMYPVRQDPHDSSLIWFGCNDGRRNSIIDWMGFLTTGAIDDPLIFAGRPGGLGLIDTTKRTITYFGPYRDLVGGRVYEFLFDSDAVWVWGRYHGSSELNGLARFDRRTGTFQPFPIQSHGFDDAWSVLTLTGSDRVVSLSVLEDGEWFNRYEFDKARREWRQPHYGWVLTAEVPVFEQPDEKSKRLDVLQSGMHFGKQGHNHYGHPVVILEESNGWQRVITCRDVAGWTRSGALTNTLDFFGSTLNGPSARQDTGAEGPRMFLWRAHLYMTHEEVRKAIQMLRDDPKTAGLFKGLADRQALGLKLAGQLWSGFTARRQSLR